MARLAMVNGAIVDQDGTGVGAVIDPPSEDVSDAEIYPACQGCGLLNYEYVPGTRGRRPKYHAECKPEQPQRAATRTRGRVKDDVLREALLIRYYQMADVAGLVHVAYGMSIREKAETAVEADLEYARSNAKFRKYLESMLDRTALGAVVAVHLAMLQPIAVGEMARRRTHNPRTPESAGQRKQGFRRPAPTPRPQPTQTSSPAGETVEPVPDTLSVVPDLPNEDESPLFSDPGMPDAEGSNSLAKPSNAAAMDGMPG